ncbi:hypothetical protein [Clostridium sp. BJN0001]|uniref:hypothetical protein n=1 Tax=Clostridium sp. BJN0001 TaxID=2930219 RepID=UPI001FD1FB64|nr:hypothetical protein [Clostridium sp. BJN0001]
MNTKQLNIHEYLLLNNGFHKCSTCKKYNSIGTCYKLDSSLGSGYYWIYTYKNLFSIVIHDFYFYNDFYLESLIPEYFSISYFKSVSCEEFNPYSKLNSGSFKIYRFNDTEYRIAFYMMLKNLNIFKINKEQALFA